MKKLFFPVAMAALFVTACKKDLQEMKPQTEIDLTAGTTAILDTVTLPQIISASRTLYADTLYVLNGKVYVTGGTLTVNQGTRVEGAYKSTPDQASALVVTKTGRINLNGTQTNPVILTSYKVGLPGGRTNRLPGDWGGLVVLGRARTNKPTTQFIEGINPSSVPAGVDVTYGGTASTQNNGIWRYARIEFAGAAIAANNELNSVTCGGVGSGTTVNNLQASYGADDAFEFFGGTVSAKYLIANSQNDDAFDFDFGYKGEVQFAISVRNPAYAYNDANGIECDNENPSTGAVPTTNPILSNLTILGNRTTALTGTLNGARFRRGTDLRFRNSILAGYATGAAFENTLAANTPTFFRNNGVHAFTDSGKFVGPPTVGPWGPSGLSVVSSSIPTNWLKNPQPAVWSTLKGTALEYVINGVFHPTGTSAVKVKPSFTGLGTLMLAVNYVGAIAPGAPVKDANGNIVTPNNWVTGTAGTWVNFDPQ